MVMAIDKELRSLKWCLVISPQVISLFVIWHFVARLFASFLYQDETKQEGKWTTVKEQ
jgi:hypothetical protein